MTLDLSSGAQRNAMACSTASVHHEAKVPVDRDLEVQVLCILKNHSARWCHAVAP